MTPLMIVVIVVIAAVFIYFASAIKIVSQFEKGLVERFGKYEKTVDPGLRVIIPFIERLVGALLPGALLHIATDHPGYAEWIVEVMRDAKGLENLHAPAALSRERPERRLTAYEADWLEEGRSMAYFDYRRSG